MHPERDRTWRVGELAAATGVSVRTLRHYDEIALLRPLARAGAGPRRYSGPDVARLQHILALRGLGLGLADIAEILDGTGPPIGDLLARQLLEVEQRLASGRRVRHVLRALLATVADEDLDPTVLTEKIKETTQLMNQLTPEQRRELEDRRRTMMAVLSDAERDEMTQRRDRAMAQLTAQESEVMARRRAAMMREQS